MLEEYFLVRHLFRDTQIITNDPADLVSEGLSFDQNAQFEVMACAPLINIIRAVEDTA
ncbi:hypothetical protein D3C86_2136640 [compost metagenome]